MLARLARLGRGSSAQVLPFTRGSPLARSSQRQAAVMAQQQHSRAAAGAATPTTDGKTAPPMLLESRDDAYGGVIIDPEALPSDPQVFARALEHSVRTWRDQGKKGLWLKIPLSKAQLVGPAAAGADSSNTSNSSGAPANGSSNSSSSSPSSPDAGGFIFHHAEADYVMMTRWLPEAVPSTLPPNASHQVGVGAFVVNERGEVLVVQEALGPLKGKQVWKMPTGLVHQGEDLLEAVEREVLEETGVRATFDALLCVRQAHGFQFGKSDLFFCVGLRTTEPGQVPRPCEVEIEAVKWMPLSEYASHHFQLGVPLYEKMLDRCVAWAEGRYAGWTGAKLQAGMWGRERLDTLVWGLAESECSGQQQHQKVDST